MRGYLVKTYNQLHYTFFKRVVSTSGTQVIIGKDNWLFEKAYLDKLNTPAKDDGSRINEQAKWLRILQDRLAEEGIAFVFVIAPSKAEVYPEYIPDEHRNPPLPQDIETDYQQALEVLLKHGVNFVDSHSMFMQEKDTGYELFGPSGTHWNKYGAYLVWKEIAKTVEGQVRPPLQIPFLAGVEKHPSDEIDADLGTLLNLWDTSLSSPKTCYPVFEFERDLQNQTPAILIIGDSFLFTLVDIVKRANLSTDVDAWYYFKRHFHYPSKEGKLMDLTDATETPMERNSIDGQNQFFGKDLIVLVETQQWLPNVGFGFVEAALQAIEAREEGR